MSAPRTYIPADAAGGWMARRLGNIYAEPLQDMQDRVFLTSTRNLAPSKLPTLGRPDYALDRLLERRHEARARLADLSQYGTYDADFKIFDLR